MPNPMGVCRWLSRRCFAGSVLGALAAETLRGQGNGGLDPYAKIRTLSKGLLQGKSFGALLDLATEIVRQTLPYEPTEATIHALAQLLAVEQWDWQERRKPALDPEKLLRALNRRLELEQGPEYLKLRNFELSRARLGLWAKLPDLAADPAGATLRPGEAAVPSSMNPLEAYAVVCFLILQKLSDSDYLLTRSEEAQRQSRPRSPRAPGLYAEPMNPRKLEFEVHLRRVAANYSNPKAATDAIRLVISEAQQ